MAYQTFGVGPIRGLGLAAAHDLPNLVVIAGPNGAGKSNPARGTPETGNDDARARHRRGLAKDVVLGVVA